MADVNRLFARQPLKHHHLKQQRKAFIPHFMEKELHQRAEICLPRKKKVLESFHSNTFRIFDETLPERLDPTDVYQNHKYLVRDPQENEMLKSHNIPHPVNAKFIRTNVRFLNEPVAHMETRHTMAEQFNWWSGLTNQDVPGKAPYSKATTQRCDFQPVKGVPVIRLRESNRPPALGIIPTISFIDQPDSPLHSGRHMTDPTTRDRAFVWGVREAGGPGTFQRAAGPPSPSAGTANQLK